MAREEQKRTERKTTRQKGRSSDGTAGMITVVVSVIFLLLLIWILANQIIGMTGGKKRADRDLPAFEESETLQSAASVSDAAESSASLQATTQTSEEASSSTVTAVTEGAGDKTEPKTWIGKTFRAKDEINIRSFAGTVGDVIGGMDIGNTIFCENAKIVEDGLWVYGKITLSDGTHINGWVYGLGLDPEPVKQ